MCQSRACVCVVGSQAWTPHVGGAMRVGPEASRVYSRQSVCHVLSSAVMYRDALRWWLVLPSGRVSGLRHPPNIDSNHPKYLYLIFTGPPLNIYQIFMNIPLKLVAPRCFGSSGFRHFWVTLTRNCRKFCFQQDARPVCGPAPSRDLCLYMLVIPIIICLWHNEQSG